MPVNKTIEFGYIYLITYPNGKLYVGQDRTDDPNYFGSANSDLVAADYPRASRRDMTIRKQVLWESEQTTIRELNRAERSLIDIFQSNDPAIGYNRSPKIGDKNESGKD